jgi:succinyl-CoA synthetase beta subunit
MNLHEYQAKEILLKYGVPIPEFGVASNDREVEEVIKRLSLKEAVVKIQVHAGGRGKGGGVRFAKNEKEIRTLCRELIGMKLINNQTGPQGIVAHQVLISRPATIVKEYYVGAIIDRQEARPLLIASPEGGMEIEEIAAKAPEKILKIPIGLDGKVKPYHLIRLCNFMEWKEDVAKVGAQIIKGLAQAFLETDASLLEINPLILTKENELMALDAKLSIDDSALFRQPDLAALYDPTQQSASEVAARQFDLSYIALDGNIGCMVNGAGLAMATMDIIQYYGGKPANFLDVGGGASKEKVAEGFKIILSDPHVKAILINIFGGIMNCAVLAEGIIAAAHSYSIRVPLIARLEGTNVDQGRQLLAESGLKITSAESLADAAQKAVKWLS